MERRRKQESHEPTKNARILVINRQKDLPIKASSVKKLVHFLSKDKNIEKEVVVHLVGKRKISQIHRQFFNDPSPTDCMTFPLDDPDLLGEIFICPKVAMEYAPKNPYRETALYIIHAFLHLLGYDDLNSTDRRQMRREENRLLKLCTWATLSLH
jgi:probable rRNA maturation factor